MNALLAQVVQRWPAGWSVADLAIAVVIVAGIVALVWIALKAMGIQPPGWFVQAAWVIVIVFVIAVGIRILAGL